VPSHGSYARKRPKGETKVWAPPAFWLMIISKMAALFFTNGNAIFLPQIPMGRKEQRPERANDRWQVFFVRAISDLPIFPRSRNRYGVAKKCTASPQRAPQIKRPRQKHELMNAPEACGWPWYRAMGDQNLRGPSTTRDRTSSMRSAHSAKFTYTAWPLWS